MSALRTGDKIALITFCTRFHLYIHAYSLILQGRNLSLPQIAGIESAVIASQFVMEIPTGAIADRIGRRWSVIASVMLMLFGEFIFLFSTAYWQYLVIAFLTGTGFAFNSGAAEALVYDSLPENEQRDTAMRRMMGRIGAMGQIAFFISPICGSFLLGDLSAKRVRWAIGLTVGTLVVGTLIALTLDDPRKAVQHKDFLSIVRSGLNALRINKQWRELLLFAVVTMPFGGTLITTLAAPYLDKNGVSNFGIGLALSVGSLGAAFTQANAFRIEKRWGTRRSLVMLSVLPGLLYLGAALTSGQGTLPAWSMVVALYAFNDMRAPLLSVAQNRLITSEARATTLSAGNMLFSFVIAVVAPLYASLATLSAAAAFVVIGAVIVVGASTLRLPIELG